MTRRFMTDHVFVDVVGDATQQAATTVTHKAVLVPRSNDARASLLEDIISVELSQRQGQVTGRAAERRWSGDCVYGDQERVRRTGWWTRPSSDSRPKCSTATSARVRGKRRWLNSGGGQFSVLVATDVAARAST